jgi:hypothetical protein
MRFNTKYIGPALLAAALSVPAFAEEAKPAAPSAPPGQSMGGMGGMGGMMGGGGMMSEEMKDQHLKQKQEHLLKMHELSTKILAAKDDKEREQLKAEQFKLMKDYEKAHMEMMQQHMKQMMQGGGTGGMGGHGGHGGGMGGGMPQGGGMGNMGGMQHGSEQAPAQAPAMKH